MNSHGIFFFISFKIKNCKKITTSIFWKYCFLKVIVNINKKKKSKVIYSNRMNSNKQKKQVRKLEKKQTKLKKKNKIISKVSFVPNCINFSNRFDQKKNQKKECFNLDFVRGCYPVFVVWYLMTLVQTNKRKKNRGFHFQILFVFFFEKPNIFSIH